MTDKEREKLIEEVVNPLVKETASDMVSMSIKEMFRDGKVLKELSKLITKESE